MSENVAVPTLRVHSQHCSKHALRDRFRMIAATAMRARESRTRRQFLIVNAKLPDTIQNRTNRPRLSRLPMQSCAVWIEGTVYL